MPIASAISVLVFLFPIHIPVLFSYVPTASSFQTEALNCFMTSWAHKLGTTDWLGDTREKADKCLSS